MEKQELSKAILIWLKENIKDNLKDKFDLLDIFIPESVLSKLPNEHIKSIPNYSSWSFKPDILAILKNKRNGKIEFIIANRSVSALSLKEIGEIHCYSKIINSIYSFLFSLNGVSSEVSILILEKQIHDNLLRFSDNKEITILTWDQKRNDIDYDSIIPFCKKENIF